MSVTRRLMMLLAVWLAVACVAAVAARPATATDPPQIQSGVGAWPSPVVLFTDLIVPCPYGDVCSDGAGGMFVLDCVVVSGVGWWAEHDIYAERIASDGSRPWGSRKVVCDAGGNQGGDYVCRPVACCADGASGMIAVWYDTSGDCMYAQRVSAGGVRLWENGAGSGDYNGIAIGDADYRSRPKLLPDGSGGAIVVWMNDATYSDPFEIRAQRLTADGAAAWSPGGVQVAAIETGDTSSAELSDLCSDGSGGVMVAFFRHFGWGLPDNPKRSYVVRVAEDGTVGTPVPVAEATAYWQIYPKLVNDQDSNVIVAWEDKRPPEGTSEFATESDIYAQKIDISTGIREWSPTGEPLCTAPASQDGVLVVPGLDHSAVAVWDDHSGTSPSSPFVYANRVGGSAATLWGSSESPGVAVQAVDGAGGMKSVCADGASGAFIAWTDSRNGGSSVHAEGSIYVQHLSADGSALWGGEHMGEPLGTRGMMTTLPSLVLTSDGALGVVWAETPWGASALFQGLAHKVVDSTEPMEPLLEDVLEEAPSLVLQGEHFGPYSESTSEVLFSSGSTPVAGEIEEWHDKWIEVKPPAGMTQPSLAVYGTAGSSNSLSTAISTPGLVSVSPTSVTPGKTVTIVGRGLSAQPGTVTFGSLAGGYLALPTPTWADTLITASIPSWAWGVGDLNAATEWGSSNSLVLKIRPRVTRISPSSGPAGTTVTIGGAGFGPSKKAAAGVVKFGATPAKRFVSWTFTRIKVRVPAGAVGKLRVSVKTSGGTSASVIFRRN